MVLEQQISEYIRNLGGRKAYELKKSEKLGFGSFEEYIEQKLTKRLLLNYAAKKKFNNPDQNENKKKDKNTATSGCGCCSK